MQIFVPKNVIQSKKNTQKLCKDNTKVTFVQIFQQLFSFFCIFRFFCNTFVAKITKKCEFICAYQEKAVSLQPKSQNSMILEVYIKGIYAGELEQKSPREYEFRYDEAYRKDSALPALCLNMPKSQAVYQSERLFAVFANMLAEGYNRRLQSRTMRIDENDDFALLAATAQYDTIGAITVKPIEV